MVVVRRFIDSIERYAPVWLRDRPEFNAGFRFLWSVIAPLDAMLDSTIEGIRAAQPGLGTPTALPYIGRSRGLIRGQADTDTTFAEKLRVWLDTWREAGSAEQIARQIQGYLANSPKVRVVTRSGVWVTLNEDGSVERHVADFPWDTVSHPIRNDADEPWWSEIWIIVYPTQWASAGTFGEPGDVFGDDDRGIGHDCSREESDAIRGLVTTWKAAHTYVRAIIWSADGTLFDPENPSSMPNGEWGAWGTTGSGSRVRSDRYSDDLRFWEF